MNTSIETVERHLKSMGGGAGLRRLPASPEIFPFVTISRQAGAGGHTLAESILQEMRRAGRLALFKGWEMFDHKICRLVAENPKLKVSLRSLFAEEYHNEIQDLSSRVIAGLSPQSEVVHETFKIVRTLAAAGKVLLVGRAGACLTRSFPGGIHLRLVAPFPTRIRRMQIFLGIGPHEAEETVCNQDRSRAALVKECFSEHIDDPLLYDAVWNTAATPMADIASLVVRWIERKAAEAAAERLALER